jgi:hypothetical protein
MLYRRCRSTHEEIYPFSPRQIALYGTSVDGMPALWVYRGSDGALMFYDGVTRATRVAILLPGTRVRVEVIGDLTAPCGYLPTVGAPSP